jgi:hypothetical protein
MSVVVLIHVICKSYVMLYWRELFSAVSNMLRMQLHVQTKHVPSLTFVKISVSSEPLKKKKNSQGIPLYNTDFTCELAFFYFDI